jgi:hypothetical protein
VDKEIRDMFLPGSCSHVHGPTGRWFLPRKMEIGYIYDAGKIRGIIRTNKFRIIQLLDNDLKQVLRVAFARNITKVANQHDDIINKHQCGKSHRTCISPILNKILMIQLVIQKKISGIIFDNDAKGCYDQIISGIPLAAVRRLGYSKHAV